MSGQSTLTERRSAHWQMLGILVVLWGSSFAINKIAIETVPAIWVVALRIILAAVLIIIYVVFRGQSLPRDRTSWLWFMWLGAVGTVLPFFLISWGIAYVPSSVAGILMAAVPLGVIVLAHILLPDEALTPQKAAGFIVGFIGVAILVGVGGFASMERGAQQFWALLAITAATACYALNGTTARLMPDMPNGSKSAGVLIAAAVIALPMAFILEPSGLSDVSLRSLLSVIALAVFPTALATIILFQVLREAGASFLAMSNYLVPVFAVGVGIFGLGENLQWTDWVGLALVLGGIFVSERRPR